MEAMDQRSLSEILSHTFNPDKDLRQNAEEGLKKLEALPGFLPHLLRLITKNDKDKDVRQAASIRLKNIIQAQWFKKDQDLISQEDRDVIKQNLFQAILFQPIPKIRVQLLTCFYRIIHADFPAQWPEIMDKIIQNLTCSDTTRVYGALCCLRQIFKKYQYITPGKTPHRPQTPMYRIIHITFPILYQAMRAIINLNTPESYEMMRIIIKIFYMSTQMEVPPFLQDEQTFNFWMPLLVQILVKPVTKEYQPQNGDISQIPLVKCQKWTARILVRFFQRYGMERYVEESWKPFARMWMEQYAVKVLHQFMTVLKNYHDNHYVSDKILYCTYSYLSTAVSYANMYSFMKEHFEFILFETSFRTLCLTHDDILLWRTDPVDFVRKSADIQMEFHDPRVAARDLIAEFVRIRTADSLEAVISTMQQIFDKYQTAKTEHKDPIRKEAALHVIGALAKYLLDSDNLKNSVEGVLITHVCPEMRSQIGFLRSRACWTLSQFHELKWQKHDAHHRTVESVVMALRDPEVPVRIEAAKAIGKLILDESAMEYVRPHIPLVLEQFFTMINELETEQIVETFDLLIDRFGDEITPYASRLCNRLVQVFVVLHSNENNEEAACAAVSAMRALNTILYGCHEFPDVFAQIELVLQPLINRMLSRDGIEYIEEIFEMIGSLTYWSKEISHFVWSLLPRICHAFHTWAPEYMFHMLPILDNYITRGSKMLCATKNPNFVEMIFVICQKVLDSNDDEEREFVGRLYTADSYARYAARLLDSMLQNCKGQINDWIPHFMTIAMKKLVSTRDTEVKLVLFSIIGSCAYYDPLLFLKICEHNNWTEWVFNQWLSHLPPHSDRMDWPQKKSSVIGLASILKVPMKNLATVLAHGLPAIATKVVDIVLDMNTEPEIESKDSEDDGDIELTDDDEDLNSESDKDDDEEGEGGDGDDKPKSELKYIPADQDYIHEEDEKYLQEVSYFAMNRGTMYDLEEDPDEDDLLRNYECALDHLDEVVYSCDALNDLKGREPDFYQKWEATVKSEKLVQLQKHLEKAQKEIEKYQKRKEKEDRERNDKLARKAERMKLANPGIANPAAS